jgi:restriction system protein
MSQTYFLSVFFAASLPLLLFIDLFFDRFSKHNKAKMFHAIKRKGDAAVQRLSWQEFERYCAGYFIAQGYKVKITGQGGADHGMDLLISKNGREAIVQCKHWKGRVGVTVVREMFGLMHAHKHQEVFIVALSGFTKQANDWAEGKPIRLIVPQSF